MFFFCRRGSGNYYGLFWVARSEIFSRYDLSCKLSGKVVFLCFLVFLFLFSIRLELQVIRKGCMLIYGEEVIANKLES